MTKPRIEDAPPPRQAVPSLFEPTESGIFERVSLDDLKPREIVT